VAAQGFNLILIEFVRFLFEGGSPDLNILDFRFFRAIRSLYHKETPTYFDKLLKSVQKSFEEYSTVKSNRIFLSLQSGMIEIMKSRGSNKYQTPHMKHKRFMVGITFTAMTFQKMTTIKSKVMMIIQAYDTRFETFNKNL